MTENDLWEAQLRKWVEQSSNKNPARASASKTMSGALTAQPKAQQVPPSGRSILDMDPNVKRMTMLPYPQQGADGNIDMTDWVAPQRMADFVEAIQMPGQVYRGELAGTEEEARKMAVDVNFGSALLGKAPAGALGMFAGRQAKNAPLESLDKAKAMADGGGNRDDIWRDTGWFEDVDGQWKWEIDDSGARFNMDAIPASESRIDMAGSYLEATHGIPRSKLATGQNPDLDKEAFAWVDENIHNLREGETALSAALTHGDAFAAYPDMMKTRLGRETSPNLAGTFSPQKNKITVGGGPISQGADAPKSTALHELQHNIQSREGFAQGGRPSGPYGAGELDEYIGIIVNDIKDLPANAGETKSAIYQHARKLAHSSHGREARYKRLAGEAEARNVQSRMDLTPEQRRDTPPWDTLDIPEEKLIVGSTRTLAENIRKPAAKFDPAKRNSADLLASNPGDPLSAAAALQKQYENKQLLKFLETGA